MEVHKIITKKSHLGFRRRSSDFVCFRCKFLLPEKVVDRLLLITRSYFQNWKVFVGELHRKPPKEERLLLPQVNNYSLLGKRFPIFFAFDIVQVFFYKRN